MGEGFPTVVTATSFLNQTSFYPTSHLLLHSSAVPLSSAFSGDSNTFQTTLKDERDIPRFRPVKDNKASPCSTVKFKRPVSQDGLNTTSLDIKSLPTPTQAKPTSIRQ